MPSQALQFPAALEVPDLDDAVDAAARCCATCIARQRHTFDPVAMPGQGFDQGAGGDVPQLDKVVTAAGQDQPAVVGDGNGGHLLFVVAEAANEAPADRVPDGDTIVGGGGDPTAVRRERDGEAS